MPKKPQDDDNSSWGMSAQPAQAKQADKGSGAKNTEKKEPASSKTEDSWGNTKPKEQAAAADWGLSSEKPAVAAKQAEPASKPQAPRK